MRQKTETMKVLRSIREEASLAARLVWSLPSVGGSLLLFKTSEKLAHGVFQLVSTLRQASPGSLFRKSYRGADLCVKPRTLISDSWYAAGRGPSKNLKAEAAG
jgi:hypothetical protein